MCGIAGFIQRRGEPDGTPVLNNMVRALKHRGPDAQGFERFECGDWEIYLGHARLSIIDHDGGIQPMLGSHRKSALTYNGEIFNFIQLRDDLKAHNIDFCTQSDTEVLLQLMHQMPWSKALTHLNGMFAFAFWDQSKNSLLLARDRFGIKPLYYCSLEDGGFVFASEISSLLAHPWVPRVLSQTALASYFFSDYVEPPETLITGCLQLKPAHQIVWTPNGLGQQTAYYDLNTPQNALLKNFELAKIKLRELFQESVQRQLIADVPTGVFLSGGIDSSLVAYEAQKYTGGQLKTFSIGFEQKDYDESSYARQFAQQIGSQHYEDIISLDKLLNSVEGILEHLDHPLADPSLIPTSLLSNLTRQTVTVALGGDGGDEMFAGYPTYCAHRWGNLYAAFSFDPLHSFLKKCVELIPASSHYQSLEWKLKRFFGRFDQQASLRHRRWMSNLDLPDLKQAMHRLPSEYKTYLPALTPGGQMPLESALLLDLMTYLPGSVLTKVDRASMFVSLEVRPPFLDNALYEFSRNLPAHFKLKGPQGKYILKEAYRGLVPDDILFRKKHGFAIPLSAWIKGPLLSKIDEAIYESELFGPQGPLQQAYFKRLRDEHLRGQRDASKPLWALFVLHRWIQKKRIQVC